MDTIDELLENAHEIEVIHTCQGCGVVVRVCVHASFGETERCERDNRPICDDCAEQG